MPQNDIITLVNQRFREIYTKPNRDPKVLPFYDFLMSLPVKYEAPRGGEPNVAATDGSYFYFGDGFANYSENDQWAIMFHEVLHVWLNHPKRGVGKDPEYWNMAADYMVNGILDSIGYPAPADGLHDRTIDVNKTTTEDIYNKLLVSGAPKKKHGDLRAYNDENEMEAERAREHATAEAQKAAENGNQILPQHLLEDMLPRPESPVDWRMLLADYVSRYSSKRKYTWSQPSKKTIGIGIYMPKYARVKEAVGVVALDESGSVTSDTELLESFLMESENIFSTFEVEGRFVLFSVKVDVAYDVPPFPPMEDISEHLTGAGTVLKSVFDYIDREMDNAIDFLIMLTDMYDNSGTFPEEPPYPVIWATRTTVVTPPYGDVVIL